jgi:hypothetical protein
MQEHLTHIDSELRLAPLVRQPVRRDGALEFVALLAVVLIVSIAAIAYVGGTPVVPH